LKEKESKKESKQAIQKIEKAEKKEGREGGRTQRKQGRDRDKEMISRGETERRWRTDEWMHGSIYDQGVLGLILSFSLLC